ncbi:MAG: hypothetical protein ACPLW8_00800 [Candidatus Bathyarchaeales archaeon]
MVGNTRMDERSRIPIPSEKRKKLRLKPGMEFQLIEEKGMLITLEMNMYLP